MPVHYLRQIAEQVRTMGGDVAAWLAHAGLDERELSEGSPAVSEPVFRELVTNALEMTNEPALGLLVGERLVASSHGILGYAAMNSASLRQAIELFERYLKLRISLVTITHDVVEGDVRIRFLEEHPLGELERPVLEAVVLATKNVLDAITMGSCTIRRVAFPFPEPRYAKLARALFQSEISWSQRWAGFVLPGDVLDVPLKMADPSAFTEAARICQRELEKADPSLASRVRRLLLEKQSGFPSLVITARLLHLTPRTLHRRLVDEGTSFKEILDDVRHELAVEHLKAGRLTIQEVAYTLGYSDMANFRRAFKRWEGVPPSRMRPGGA